jgi:hypothetical protein
LGKKVPFNFHLNQNNGESTPRVDSVTERENIKRQHFFTRKSLQGRTHSALGLYGRFAVRFRL